METEKELRQQLADSEGEQVAIEVGNLVHLQSTLRLPSSKSLVTLRAAGTNVSSSASAAGFFCVFSVRHSFLYFSSFLGHASTF